MRHSLKGRMKRKFRRKWKSRRKKIKALINKKLVSKNKMGSPTISSRRMMTKVIVTSLMKVPNRSLRISTLISQMLMTRRMLSKKTQSSMLKSNKMKTMRNQTRNNKLTKLKNKKRTRPQNRSRWCLRMTIETMIN